MCDRYTTVRELDIQAMWNVAGVVGGPRWDLMLTPRARGPFLRRSSHGVEASLACGQWGLIPWFAKEARLPYQPTSARVEDAPARASYELPWARGQRCIIPAQSFDTLCWDAGRHVWWRLRRADGKPWALAGLWNTWVDQETDEVHESFTMLTVDASAHPLLSHMYKAVPQWSPEGGGQRSVVPLERDDVVHWLTGTEPQARALLRLPPMEAFEVERLPL